LLFGLARLLRDLLACHMGGAHMLIRLDQRHARHHDQPRRRRDQRGDAKGFGGEGGFGHGGSLSEG
jgi:hypothetical protein